MRLRRTKRAVGAVAAWLLAATAALACTTVALGPPDDPVIAYSFDYAPTGAGLLVVNPRHGTRRSVLEAPARWAIRHGSVTVNQMGPGMPVAGMNTAGLVVTLMWNDDAVFAGDASRPMVSELEFIQRLLDMNATVDEAIAAFDTVRIRGFVPIHYFLADAAGDTAVVTPVDDGLRIHTGIDLPVPALTNTGYDELAGQLPAFSGFGGTRDLPLSRPDGNPGSLTRFLIAAAAWLRTGPGDVDAAFDVLDRLANRTTRWQMVFDPGKRRISLRVGDRAKTLAVDFAEMDFRCRAAPVAAELPLARATGLAGSLAPVGPAVVSAVSRQVLATLDPAAGLGPHLADGLTNGLLEAVDCQP